MAEANNPFDKNREPKRHRVAAMLLSTETVSWTEICEQVGNLSPRTMGFVLRALEDQGVTVLRMRDSEYGTLYRHDPECPFEERYRLSKTDGADAHRQRSEREPYEPPPIQDHQASQGTGVR